MTFQLPPSPEGTPPVLLARCLSDGRACQRKHPALRGLRIIDANGNPGASQGMRASYVIEVPGSVLGRSYDQLREHLEVVLASTPHPGLPSDLAARWLHLVDGELVAHC